MAKPRTLAELPPALQQYVHTGTPFPSSYRTDYTKVEVLLAKQLRKRYFRTMALTEPGSQYEYSDFWQLMQYEVWTHVRTRLYPVILQNWERFVTDSPESITVIWKQRVTAKESRLAVATPARKQHLLKDLQLRFLNEIYRDPRRLGIMESFVLNRIIFGVPPGHNFKRKDS